LAIVSSIARGRVNFWEIALIAALATVFTVVMAVWGTTGVKRVLPFLDLSARADDAEFHIAMVFLFVLALLAQYTGVAAIVGAFSGRLWPFRIAPTPAFELSRAASANCSCLFFLQASGLHLNSESSININCASGAGDSGTAIVTKLIGCGAGALSLGWQNVLKVVSGWCRVEK